MTASKLGILFFFMKKEVEYFTLSSKWNTIVTIVYADAFINFLGSMYN